MKNNALVCELKFFLQTQGFQVFSCD